MANNNSALKRIRQTEKRRTYNRVWRSRSRTFVKRAKSEIGSSPESALEAVRIAIRELDMAASKGVIHARNAARRKSRLMKAYNAAQAK